MSDTRHPAPSEGPEGDEPGAPSTVRLPPSPLPDAPPGEAAVLVIAHPENKLLGARYRLPRGAALEIGRAATADISLPDVPSVSRRHARLRLEQQVTIEDLGSTNGTLVGERRIEGVEPLASGARFQAGAVHFKLLHEDDVEQAYHSAIYEMMMRDGLTQLYNRRKFHEEAERECLRARRYARPLSLVLYDVDRFKAINDTYGHLCGDAVLQKVAAVTRELTRAEQVVARIGGEEFAILCPEVPATGAAVLADRLRRRVAEQRHREGEREFAVTCSFGVAEWRPEMTSLAELHGAADRALYAAKQGGRDRVSLASQGG